MSQYFDHVKCPDCGTAFDPEKVATRGRQLSCPKCGAVLALTDLFGISDAFSEDDQPNLDLEDVIPQRSEPSTQSSGTGAAVPGRPIDQSPMGALDALKQLKKKG